MRRHQARRGRRLRRLSDRCRRSCRGAGAACRRSCTSRTPCWAAPTGCSRRASTRSRRAFRHGERRRALARQDRRHRQSGAAGRARGRGTRLTRRRAERAVPPARLRRQPGRARLVRCRAGRDRALPAELRARLRIVQQARDEDVARVRAAYARARRRGRGLALLHRHAGPHGAPRIW